jgi:tol-pal system protein YbgF
VDNAQASYDAAFGLTRARSVDQAETAWRNVLKQYPEHPLDGSAQYFLGETYFGRNDYQHAAAAYAVGVEKYPKSDLAVETMLKLGIALGRAGQVGPACDTFKRLDHDFPDVSGVVHERALVEKRHYQCPEEARKLVVPEPRPAPILATAPGPTVTPSAEAAAPVAEAPSPPGAVASLEHGSDIEPPPPAVPTIPVERQRLKGATDAERAKARAELYVTPPPSASGKAAKSVRAVPSGPTGDTVKTAQILLAALDYDTGPVNGQMGTKLHEAIRAFETKDGMRPDGEISDRLLQRLSFTLATRKAGLAPVTRIPRIAGTGFLVSRSGFIITSNHLVAACPDIRVRTLGSAAVTPTLVASDPADDLALLQVKTDSPVAVRFRDGRGLRQGDNVVVTGLTPREEEVSDFYLASGTVGATPTGRNETGLLKINASVTAERGGAPVFDRAGQLVGVLSDGPVPPAKSAKAGAASETGLAMRATIARNFLDQHDVDYESAISDVELKEGELADLAKAVVVLVECRH